MSRLLNDLDARFKPLAFELIARCAESQIAVLIVNTRRTAAEQAANLAKGVSWVTHSKHEDGLAIDIVPYDVYQLKGIDKLQWDINDPVWLKIVTIGEALGLKAGYRWKQRDAGHFEYVAPVDRTIPGGYVG